MGPFFRLIGVFIVALFMDRNVSMHAKVRAALLLMVLLALAVTALLGRRRIGRHGGSARGTPRAELSPTMQPGGLEALRPSRAHAHCGFASGCNTSIAQPTSRDSPYHPGVAV
jgi:hypothetical protein